MGGEGHGMLAGYTNGPGDRRMKEKNYEVTLSTKERDATTTPLAQTKNLAEDVSIYPL